LELEELRVDSLGCGCFPGDETFPGFVAFFDYFEGIFLVLAFTAESKRVFWFTIGNLPSTVSTKTPEPPGEFQIHKEQAQTTEQDKGKGNGENPQARQQPVPSDHTL